MAEGNNYDAEFCGKLAIHQTNTIQDYGFLLVLDQTSLEIIQGSENIISLVNKTIQELIGINFSNYLTAEDLTRFQAELLKGQRNRVPFNCQITVDEHTQPVDLLLHIKNNQVLIEIEKSNQIPERSFSEVFQEVRSFISVLEGTENLYEICQASISEIRRLAGFDGIRMYRFDSDWNGTVIAEEIEGELETYLGHTFPASDVPKQARALYSRNPYRLIPNRNYKASRLFPVINPITNGFLDLSECNLRSIAAVHLEYMANMNVTASMSIRVMVNGVLWGLISCHHVTAKYLSTELRSIFEWLSLEISYRISSVIKQDELTITTRLLKTQSALTEHIFTTGSIEKGLIDDTNKNLLSLLNASGFAITINGKTSTAGIVPEAEELENLLIWTSGKVFGQIFHTQKLGEIYDDAQSYPEIASGIMVIPINASKGDFLICFRPEVIKNINWGGNPNQAINFEKDGVNYHPRNSFKLWQQTVHGQSQPWTQEEMEVAESIRNFMLEFNSR